MVQPLTTESLREVLGPTRPAALGQFGLGKSEVAGLRGAPDQAYAAELAQRGYLTVSPDAIGFEDRNWAGGSNAYDVEDVLSAARGCRYLLIAGADDVWSRGAAGIASELAARGLDHVTVRIRPGGHEFPAADRELAYGFLASALS